MTIANEFDTSNAPQLRPNVANKLKMPFLGTQALHLSWHYLAILAVSEATTAAAVATVGMNNM